MYLLICLVNIIEVVNEVRFCFAGFMAHTNQWSNSLSVSY